MSEDNVVSINSKTIKSNTNKKKDVKFDSNLHIEVVNKKLYDLNNSVVHLLSQNNELTKSINMISETNVLLSNKIAQQAEIIQSVVNVISTIYEIISQKK